MNPEESSFSCIAKASSEWDSVVTWRGFNEIGKELKAVDIKCEKILKKELDTGLVKLWAGNSNRISEKYETNFGYNYEIVTKEYSLHARTGDTIPDNQKSVPNLSENEIIPPVTAQKTFRNITIKPCFRMEKNGIGITFKLQRSLRDLLVMGPNGNAYLRSMVFMLLYRRYF